MNWDWMWRSFRRRIGAKDNAHDGYIGDAAAYILAYTRRTDEQWLGAFEPIAVRIAIIDYNRAGVEGAQSRSEGGVSTSFGGVEDYPASITNGLNSYRLIKGGGVR